MAKTWTGVLARIGTPTGDGRIIAPGALSMRDLPLPLMWQRVSGDGHSGAVTVGAIESMTIDNESGLVMGSGRWLDVRGSADAERQTAAGVTGPSVDLSDDIEIIEAQKLVAAGVVGPDVTSNMDDIEYTVGEDGLIVITRARIAGATLVQIPAFASVSIDMGPDSEDERESVYDVLRASAARLEGTEGTGSLPPAEWFRAPDVDRLTPVTVSDTGRVFGHIAGWDTCHVGLPGCVTPPRSATDYAYFHVAAQPTREGGRIAVGTLVTGPRHADPQLAFQAAAQHYDDLDCAVAKVVAGEDEYGIWVAGWMVPGASEAKVAQFMSSPVSGDWRRVAGGLELIAVCSVNTPGFPVRARVGFALQEQNCLIASTGVVPVEGDVEGTEGTPSLLPELDDSLALWAWADTEV